MNVDGPPITEQSRPPGSRHSQWRWPSPLVVVGLTGGVASGKSTIRRMFAELGATVIDADQVGREVVQPGEPALAEIVAAFGPHSLQQDGQMSRAWVGQRVFHDRRARATLNHITHPRIRRAIASRIQAIAAAANKPEVVIVEAALLFDAGWDTLADEIVLVATEQTTQVARLMQRQSLPPPEAWARVHAQTPWRNYAAQASWIIRGDISLDETRREITCLWRELQQLAAQRLH